MEGSFDTTFGTIGRADFTTGTSRLSGTLRGRQVATQFGGATAGWDTNPSSSPPWPVVHLQVAGIDGLYYQMWINVDPQYFVSGATVSLDQGQAGAYVGFWNPATRTWTDGGSVANGQVRLERATLVDGGAVSGRISGWVVQW
jgi:hypothetical protein